MRENIGIFRGKRVDTGLWKEGYLLGPQGKKSGKNLFFIVDKMGEYHRVDPETVGEFTGLTDENGVKIFEGDIIKRKRTDGNWYNYEVFWWDNCWGIKNGVSQCLIIPQCGVQLSGNIHDNPELLGGDDHAAD